MNDLLQLWESFKYTKFEEDDEVFEFLRLARVNQDDVLEKFEAIGFYHGFKSKGE